MVFLATISETIPRLFCIWKSQIVYYEWGFPFFVPLFFLSFLSFLSLHFFLFSLSSLLLSFISFSSLDPLFFKSSFSFCYKTFVVIFISDNVLHTQNVYNIFNFDLLTLSFTQSLFAIDHNLIMYGPFISP